MSEVATVSSQAMRESGTACSVRGNRGVGRALSRIPPRGALWCPPVSEDGEDRSHEQNRTCTAGRRRAPASTTTRPRSAVDAVVEAITDELKSGNEVAISGFGKFSVADRAARQGVNPATGEKIQIKASKAAKFSAASGLKNTLNG